MPSNRFSGGYAPGSGRGDALPDENLNHLTSTLADRYRIEREIGLGGMATVYLAQDLKHHRKVAVKVLKPELAAMVGTERFLTEIRNTANLSHPHILPLFDSGEADGYLYYVMPYVEGESLRVRLDREKQLSVEEVLSIGDEVADALAFAHARGLVHRDVKPANILLGAGHAMLADFGVAKAVAGGEGGSETRPGTVLGTPHYMSPEQAAGDVTPSPASDVYSLGCVLYEMLTGQPPFTGPNAQVVLARHLADAPLPLTSFRPAAGPELSGVVAQTLEKLPADRFPDGEAIRRALRAVRSRGPGRHPTATHHPTAVSAKRRSLAVLPLQNMSGDPDQTFFADGMTEALITDLAKIEDFRVISRTSAMRYRGSKKSIPEIAGELGVELVIEGSVVRAGDEVRVTAQLIDAATDTHVWAESYDRTLTNILSLQAEVARQVAQEVKGRLTSQDRSRLGERHRVNPAAHDAYLRGRHFWNLRGKNLQKGRQWFERALDLDPDYAPAYAGLADTHALLGFYGVERPLEAMPRAKEAALRALELDDQLGEPHACLGYVHTVFDWRWRDAEREFQRSFELNPSNGSYWYWHANLLGAQGRYEEAIALLKRGLEYDPLSIYMHSHLGLTLFTAGRYTEAEEAFRQTLEMEPSMTLARSTLGLTHHFQGRSQEGLEEIQQGVRESGRHQFDLWMLGSVYADLGRRGEAEAVLEEFVERRKREFVMNAFIASIHGLLGRKDEAFRWLEAAYEEREFSLAGLGYHLPNWTYRGLEGDPRFMDLVRRVREDPQ